MKDLWTLVACFVIGILCVPPLQAARDTQVPSENTPGGSPSTMVASARVHPANYLLRLPQGDQSALPFVQRNILAAVLRTSTMCAFARSGEWPATLPELLPQVAVWPVSTPQASWEIMDSLPLQQPSGGAILWAPTKPLSSLRVVAWAPGAPAQEEERACIPNPAVLDPATLDEIRLQGQDQGRVSPASACLRPVSQFRLIFGRYPATPAEAFRALGMGARPLALREYDGGPAPQWWIRRDRTGVALLLPAGSGDQQRWLLFHEADPDRLSGTQTTLGHGTHGQAAIDAKLGAYEVWQSWEDFLAEVPAISGP